MSKSSIDTSGGNPRRVLDGHGIQRRAMAGQGIPVLRAIRNASQMYHKHLKYTGREVQTYQQRYELLAKLLTASTGRPVSGSRVLEVGCGQRAVMPLLFAAQGAEASAVDVELPTYDMNVVSFLGVLGRNGFHRAIKSAFRHVLFDHRFFKGLEQTCGVAMKPFPAIDVEVMDAARTELPRDKFDMVFTFNVLEHIVDVESAVRNMNGSLKLDGVGLAVVHLFSSLSGGHCLDWQYALDSTYPEWGIPCDVPAWDHLRESRFPADSFLNKMRLGEYRRIFNRETVVLAEHDTREGVDLLPLAPPELLSEYGRDDLITAFASFTFRKKING